MELLSRLKYIFKLIITTPRFPWIIIFNLISAFFTFVGIPLLLPALEYLRTDVIEERNSLYLKNVENAFNYIGLEANFYSVVLMATGFIFIGQLILLLVELFNKRVQIKLINYYMNTLITRYYKANWEWISKDQSGRFHSAVNREAGAASEAHLDSQRLFSTLLQVAIYVVLALSLSVTITIWAALFFAIILLINVKYANKINSISKKSNDAFISLSSLVSSLIQNKKFFKASKNYGPFMKIVIGQVEKVYKTNWELTVVDGVLKTFTTMAGMVCIIMIFLLHPLLNINLSELILILVVFNRLAPQFGNLSSNYTRISERIPIHQSVNNRIRELEVNEEVTGSGEYISKTSISFQNLFFSYTKDKMVLKNVDIEIKPLCATAFVGGSGAGKSTILDLILGLIKPDSGTIYYGDVPHQEVNIDKLRKKIAYVSQETTLLDGSLLENLSMGCSDVTEDKIKDICQKVNIEKLINELPEGLQTEIGENGIKLSGGQRQRVALGRALLINPEILILDEATSQLDSETEALIQDAIRNLHQELTIIIVAHRLSTVKFADMIYVIEDGSVCESGSYEELLKQKGRLYYLDSLQQSSVKG